MSSDSLVSVVVIFLNAERFLEETVRSVLDQTYQQWELLLVDDGSMDASTEIAQRHAAQDPGRVRYLEHPGHRNRGKGASRNLGIRHARGKYIAFLDADDVWLPQKLAEQVSILDSQPYAGMLYGNTLYWHSWTQSPGDMQRDCMPRLGIQTGVVIEPPGLLPLFLRGRAAVPCTCSILVRRSVADQIGGFDETFTGVHNIYEDQAFYAKVCLEHPVYVSNACWDRYRQHSDASIAVARKMGHLVAARQFFLRWLEEYLVEQREKDPDVWRALRRELWRMRYPLWLPSSDRLQYLARWVKKWLLRLEERTILAAIRQQMWLPQRIVEDDRQRHETDDYATR